METVHWKAFFRTDLKVNICTLFAVDRLGLMLYNIRPSLLTLARVQDIDFQNWFFLSKNCLLPAERSTFRDVMTSLRKGNAAQFLTQNRENGANQPSLQHICMCPVGLAMRPPFFPTKARAGYFEVHLTTANGGETCSETRASQFKVHASRLIPGLHFSTTLASQMWTRNSQHKSGAGIVNISWPGINMDLAWKKLALTMCYTIEI